MALATDLRAAEPRARLHVHTGLAAEGEIELAADQTHYLARVLRLGPGAIVALFNGRDGEWAAEIVAVAKHRCSLRLVTQRRVQQAGADLALLFAPVKRQAVDLLVRQATELGVRTLRPVITARTVAERVNAERLHAIAVEAAEQCERLDVPALAAAERLDRVLAAWEDGRRLFIGDETGRGLPIAQAVDGAADAPAAVLCGPEGGFTVAELDAVGDLPFVTRVALGPRILRSETAALAIVAVWQALCGDWGHARLRRESEFEGAIHGPALPR